MLRRFVSTATRETFFALASPPGKAGVAVYRISGPAALQAYKSLVQPAATLPKPWKLHRCTVQDPDTGARLDDGLAVYFAAPRSYTGLDTLELHLHSGRALCAAVLDALARVPGCRPARPGEFTRAALTNGKMDLTQAEGLRDLLDAETDAQRRIARVAAEGKTRKTMERLREGVIGALARVEAIIDFGDSEEIEPETWNDAVRRVTELRETIEHHLADGRRGEILRAGIRLAIFGPPNAGKSSLFNFFARREAALVTPLPGTTRDVLELSLDLGGFPLILVDTAGLRETDDVVEKLGIERARSAITDADLSLCVLSMEDRGRVPKDIQRLITPNTLVLYNKLDVAKAFELPAGQPAWTVSVRTGDGMDTFLAGLTRILSDKFDVRDTEEPVITHARHRYHLERAHECLDAFLALPSEEVVLAAQELRYAANELGRVVGAVGVEDVLDALFKDFCIGK
ncbi:tRNA modification GTPase GTPBP3 [Exidia glandulosa HHB12029]|uniref:tRNA modification GTPase GTPBP3 n=1 Tax=Exidia glandulosa HHB12029 TaxID=1314781 RepID=A0A165QLS0_EXIGL|nr:tRNA modification GTPase GTPBP3 [Exidia glandulosa HHB12029]